MFKVMEPQLEKESLRTTSPMGKELRKVRDSSRTEQAAYTLSVLSQVPLSKPFYLCDYVIHKGTANNISAVRANFILSS